MILSICIPTYDRAEYLRRTIASIVEQPAWAEGETEIVISDNCSHDRTPEVIAEFSERFPQSIRSVRQPVPLDPHDNFETVLRMGRGDFLKLNNDTLTWKNGALGDYLELLKRNTDAGVILTPNTMMAPVYGKREVKCPDLQTLFGNCSYFLTWIGAVCFRRDAFLSLPDPSRRRESRLTQTDMVLRLTAGGVPATADGRIFFESLPFFTKNPESIVHVFGINFLDMVREYVPKRISPRLFAREKRRMFRDFIIPSYFDFFHEYPEVRRTGYWKCTVRYHRELYFYTGFARIAVLWLLGRCFSHDTLRRIKHFLTGGGAR